ncbi:MAG TPA: hypothetical protein VG325_17085 [Solirubrobacteraceae bacterium]|nr:hypothetical protein [Solirubrobacteraceae bacterium]
MSNSPSRPSKPKLELVRVLAVLDQVGALTTGALARGFSVSDHQAHTMMTTAERRCLVYSPTADTWTITERGRETLASLSHFAN